MQDNDMQNKLKHTEKEMISIFAQAARNKLYMVSQTENGFLLYTMLGQVFHITCKEITDKASH